MVDNHNRGCPGDCDGRQLGRWHGRWWKMTWKTTSKLGYHLKVVMVEDQSLSSSSDSATQDFPGKGRQPGRWWKMTWIQWKMSSNRLDVVRWSQLVQSECRWLSSSVLQCWWKTTWKIMEDDLKMMEDDQEESGEVRSCHSVWSVSHWVIAIAQYFNGNW